MQIVSKTYCLDLESRGPSFLVLFGLGLQDAEADLTSRVNVGVIDLTPEQAHGCLHWVVIGAEHLDWEHATSVGCIGRSVNLAPEVSVVSFVLLNDDSINCFHYN